MMKYPCTACGGCGPHTEGGGHMYTTDPEAAKSAGTGRQHAPASESIHKLGENIADFHISFMKEVSRLRYRNSGRLVDSEKLTEIVTAHLRLVDAALITARDHLWLASTTLETAEKTLK